MAERRQTIAVIAILGVAALLIVTALIVTGGPVHARKEHRDTMRRSDLMAIKHYAQCMVRTDQDALPKALAAVPGCGKLPRQHDPFTNVDYHYEVLDPTTLRLCAGFELSQEEQADRYEAEAVINAPNCLDFQIPRPAPSRSAPDEMDPAQG